MSHNLRNTQAMLSGLEFIFQTYVMRWLRVYQYLISQVLKFLNFSKIFDIKILSAGHNWSFSGHLLVKNDPLSIASIFRQNSM